MGITLLTAVPGGGKTAYAVQNVILKAFREKKIIYTCGIPKLKIPTIELTYDQLRQWNESKLNDRDLPELINIEHNSIIVVDEVQKLWPAMGSKTTQDISDLSVHRHFGLTFFLITQSPQLINRYVLKLVEKHLHIRSTWAGRKLYEWSEYCNNPTAKSNRDLAVQSPYKLPKHVFKLYHSATAHVKTTKRLPAALFVLIIAVCVTLFYGYSIASKHLMQKPQEQSIENKKELDPRSEPLDNLLNVPEPVKTALPPVSTAEAKQPLFNTQLLTTSINWNQVTACLKSEKSCVCYGQSAEKLIVPKESCELAVSSGWSREKT